MTIFNFVSYASAQILIDTQVQNEYHAKLGLSFCSTVLMIYVWYI